MALPPFPSPIPPKDWKDYNPAFDKASQEAESNKINFPWFAFWPWFF